MKTLSRLGFLALAFVASFLPLAHANSEDSKFCPTDRQMERSFKTEKACLKFCGAHFDRAYGGKPDEWFGCSRFGRGWTCNLHAAGCQWIPVSYPKEVYDAGRKRTDAVEASRKKMEKEVTAALDRDAEASRPPPTKAPVKVAPIPAKKAPPKKRN